MAADTLNQGQPAKSMSFGTVTSTPRSDSSARIGTIKISGCKDVETPGFFAVGSRGVVPHLTPDVISAHTQFGGIHMALEDCKFEADHVMVI
jgi:queuine tRNA-ribosyltransferase subunit QTRTD1